MLQTALTISDLESLVSILSAIDWATSKLALMVGRTESHWAFRLSTSKSPNSVVFCFEKGYYSSVSRFSPCCFSFHHLHNLKKFVDLLVAFLFFELLDKVFDLPSGWQDVATRGSVGTPPASCRLLNKEAGVDLLATTQEIVFPTGAADRGRG